ncbi:MAG TPA: hypothetical protein VK119_11275 [Bacillota bacterium]|nr:hypothetical protein [Bacillota bacterium]
MALKRCEELVFRSKKREIAWEWYESIKNIDRNIVWIYYLVKLT